MGPFLADFDPQAESLSQGKMLLNQTRTAWLSFRDFDGKTLLYFSHLISYRGSLSEIKYGIDSDQPTESFPFPEYDKPGFAPTDSSTNTYIEIPSDTQYVTAQITFKNGDKSSVERFNRP
jgi:hypothetical protein